MWNLEFETTITHQVWDEADDAFWDAEIPVIVRANVSKMDRRVIIEDYEVRYVTGPADGRVVEDGNLPIDQIKEEIVEKSYEG